MQLLSVLEVDSSIIDKVRPIRNSYIKYISKFILESSLSSLDVTVRYIPIIMHADFIKKYPARSKLNKKKRIFDCCPQLNYDIFTVGNWSEKVTEFSNGLNECKDALPLIGLNANQLQEFMDIINKTKEIIIKDKEIFENIDHKRKMFLDSINNKRKPDLEFYREALTVLKKDLSKITNPDDMKVYVREIDNLKAEARKNFPEIKDFI